MSHRACAYIDLAALQHNLACVQEYAPKAEILPIVKANAYGHDIALCLPALKSARALGVATVGEAQQLRALGWTKPILVTTGCHTFTEYDWCAKASVWPVIYSLATLEMLAMQPTTQKLSVWIECDSGMHRAGLLPQDIESAKQLLSQCPHLHVECWASHFSSAHIYDTESVAQQWSRFQDDCAAQPLKSMANSAAILNYPDYQGDWVRPGLMLYGISPFADKTGQELGLKPVMTLKARLISKRELQAGDTVGYMGTWRAPDKGATIGTVSLGYADGYPWLKDATGVPAYVAGHQVKLVGQVSMDSMTIDLSHCPDVPVGSMVTLWGSELPIEHVARYINQIPYVLVATVGARVPRFKKQADQAHPESV